MKKHFLKYFLRSGAVLAGMLTLGSCVFEDYDPATPDASQTEDGIRLVMHIRTLGSRYAADNEGAPIEMMRSLRIIMIDESGHLEANDRIVSDQTMKEAAGYTYSYMRMISPGKKRVYLVANEEQTGSIGISDMTDLPAGLPLGSMTDLLSYFRAGTESTAMGTNLEKVLNRVYFKSDLKPNSDGTIYLPYSAVYDIEVNDDTEHPITQLETPLYLVPAATKVDLVFINHRKADAQVEDVLFCNVNPHNYLNAQLEDSEKTRKLEDNEVWWIDWLQACAETSQTAEDNTAFNRQWGWIKYYGMPLPDEKKEARSLNTNGDEWVVDGLVDRNNPSSLKVGPFYLPEGKQPYSPDPDDLIDPDDPPQAGDHRYTLTFKVHNRGTETVYTIEGNVINNLKAFFRATHVVITAEFYENNVEIYAEISPWIKRLFLGYVQEED